MMISQQKNGRFRLPETVWPPWGPSRAKTPRARRWITISVAMGETISQKSGRLCLYMPIMHVLEMLVGFI